VQGLRSHRAAAVVELEDGLALADGLGGLRALVGALDPDLGFGRSAVSDTEASSISVDLGYNGWAVMQSGNATQGLAGPCPDPRGAQRVCPSALHHARCDAVQERGGTIRTFVMVSRTIAPR
jgi:hypothetical protein